MLIKLPITQWAYIQTNPNSNWDFYIRLSFKKISLSLLGTLLNCCFEVMKLLYNILKRSNLLFATYYPHYKKKIVSNPTWIFVYITTSLYLYGLSNLLITFFFTYDDGACTAKSGLVTKKRKLSKTSLYFFSYIFQSPSLFFSLIILEICPTNSKCLAISKCTALSKWQFNSTFFQMHLAIFESLMLKCVVMSK